MVALSAAANFTVCRTVLDGYTIHKQAVYRAVVREQVSALGPGQFANRTVKGLGGRSTLSTKTCRSSARLTRSNDGNNGGSKF